GRGGGQRGRGWRRVDLVNERRTAGVVADVAGVGGGDRVGADGQGRGRQGGVPRRVQGTAAQRGRPVHEANGLARAVCGVAAADRGCKGHRLADGPRVGRCGREGGGRRAHVVDRQLADALLGGHE